MIPGIVIEPLGGTSDLDAILEIDRQSFSVPWTREMYRQELQSDRSFVIVARAPACPVAGYCSYRIILDEIHINNVAVRGEWRRHGIGRLLMERILADGRASGMRAATLEVRRSNAGALALYERLGFAVGGVRKSFYHDPAEDGLVLWATIQAIGAGSGA